MYIGGSICGVCVGTQIMGLAYGGKNAREAMRIFCFSVLGKGDKGAFCKGGFGTPWAHYTFTAGPEGIPAGWEKISGHWKPDNPYYATNFAKFIEENKLGKVATTGPVLNLALHPQTTCQVWIFQPDHDALRAWWKAEMAEMIKNGEAFPADARYLYETKADPDNCKCPQCAIARGVKAK